jgi:hypothetical protein
MATSRTARNRPLISWLFIIAGALLLIEFIFTLVAPTMTSAWLLFLAFAALAVAFALLAPSRSADLLLRIAFVVAAVGWALLALAEIIPGFGTVLSIASVLALIGTLVAGILVFLRHFFTRNADIAFLIAAIAGALLLLDDIRHGFLPAILVTILTVLFGALLVVTGVVMQRRR